VSPSIKIHLRSKHIAPGISEAPLQHLPRWTNIYQLTLHQVYYTLQHQEGDGAPIIPSMDGIAFAQSNKDTVTTENVSTLATDDRSTPNSKAMSSTIF
jgi:hypothetical protein